jgi:tetratricopeptide (TPR) repeat protein
MRLDWDFWDVSGLAFLAVPPVWAMVAQFFHSGYRYNRLIQAASWGRWEEVLELLPDLQGRISPHEIAFRKAQALAGLGHLDEALDAVRPFGDGRQIPLWLYHARLALVYRFAGRLDEVVPCHERALEAAPDNTTVMVDLAVALLRYRRDVVRAQAVLERIRGRALSEISSIFLELAEGALALEQGDAREAVRRLERCFALAAPLRGNGMLDSALDVAHALLGLSHAALGEATAAEWHFRQAEPRLRALRSDDLLARCARARAGLGPALPAERAT